MFKKGKRLVLSYGAGHNQREISVVVESEKPLAVQLLEGDAQDVEASSGRDKIVNLCDPEQGDVLTAVMVESRKGSKYLRLRSIGQREMRRFVRITTWVELSHNELPEEDQELGLDAFIQPELGQPLPPMTESQLQSLADTDEASEAVLYMLKALQAMDQKIEALASLTKQLIERTYQVQMSRQRVNISGSGLMFEHSEPYEVGSVLNLRMRLPGMRHDEIIAHAKVVRVDSFGIPEDGGIFGIACDFVKILESDREKIIAFTVKKQREALRRIRIQGQGF